MVDWGEFIAALAVFFLSHAIPVRPPVRPWLVERLGERGFAVGYSVFSLAVLAWLIVASGRAPYVEILPYADWQLWVPVLSMPLVCWLAVAGLAASNPLSFGGLSRAEYDPGRPGILAATRHPLLLALMIWALAHLVANGDLAHVILFGLFAGFAGLGMGLIDRRKQRQMGAQAWEQAAANTSRFSLTGLSPASVVPWQIVLAAALYAGLLFLHLPVIGVPVLP